MPEANVANTVTILGRTNVVRVFTHWNTIVQNDPQNRAAIKVNSLFITNRSVNVVTVDLRLARDPDYALTGVYHGNNAYFHLMNEWVLPQNTTVVAISRDNPVWLQAGDFLQVLSSLNYCVEAVCSYEFISDQSPAPTTTITTPGPVLNLNAAPVFKSGDGGSSETLNGGVELTWNPPLSDGGVSITNYLVQFRIKAVVSTSPTTVEARTNWLLLERPVSSIPNLTISESVLLAQPRALESITTAYTPLEFDLSSTSLDGYTVSGFDFRVAAYNPLGVGAWSDPSEFISMGTIGTVGDFVSGTTDRVGTIEAISIEAVPNGAVLDWEGKTAKLTPRTDETLTIKDYRVRWSDDNGVTWYPSAAGVRLNNTSAPPPRVEVRGLQNDTHYVFSLQTICSRTIGGVAGGEMVGPWSPPTRNIMPPGFSTDEQRLNALKVMFVRWE